MIRWALAEMRSALVSTRRRRSSSSSSVSTLGSITTPLPITHSLPRCRIPDGIRWSFQVCPLRTIVWPALLPPWKRTTTSARSASRSVTFPFPSSPHWAPTTTRPGIALLRLGAGARGGCVQLGARLRTLATSSQVVSHDGNGDAHLTQPGDDAFADLVLELVLGRVRGDHERALVLPALVDDRVELLENPVGPLL